METELEFLDDLMWIIENPVNEDEPQKIVNKIAEAIVERRHLLTNEEEQ